MSDDDEDLKGLTIRDAADIAEYFEQEPKKIIGTVRKRMTDEENAGFYPSVYEQGKYRLDKNGDPLGAEVLLAGIDNGHYHNTLAEGFDLLGEDYDDEPAGGMQQNDPLASSGFNDW